MVFKKTKEVEQELLFPFHYGRRTKKGSITVNPLYWFSESEKQKYGREEYDREGGLVETSWGTPPLLPLLSRKESKHRKITKSLCGLLYNNTAKGNEISGSVLGFIAGWESDAESSSFRIPSIFNMTGLVDFAKTEDISKVNLLLYSHEKSPEVTRRDIFPFMTWDSGKNESGFSYLFFHGELNRRS